MTKPNLARSCLCGFHLADVSEFSGKGAQALSLDVAARVHTQSNRLATEQPKAAEALLVIITAARTELGRTTVLASEHGSLTFPKNR